MERYRMQEADRRVNLAALMLSTAVRRPALMAGPVSAPPSIPTSAFDDYMDAMQEKAELERAGPSRRKMRLSDQD